MAGKKIQDAFIAYCKASISDYYEISSGQTATGLLVKFSEKEIDELWMKFIADLKSILSQ